MSLVNCTECNESISTSADACPHCGGQVSWTNINHNKFSAVTSSLKGKQSIKVDSGLNKTLKWFVLVNAAVILSISLTTVGAGVAIVPLLLLTGSTFPFGALLLSKWLATKSHNIRLINHTSDNESEIQLYELVDSLRKRAGLEEMPEVGVYPSEEMNAFATGASKKNALVAFSDALLKKMDENEIAAVAAHEIAHIANGDMITLSIVQSVTNALVLLVSIPLSILKIGALFSDQVDWLGFMFIALVKFIVVTLMLFLGNLVVKAFSRKREFEADKLAAELLNKKSMIKALKRLQGEASSINYSKGIENYASLKISSPLSKFGDLFSTHPSIQRRIDALSGK